MQVDYFTPVFVNANATMEGKQLHRSPSILMYRSSTLEMRTNHSRMHQTTPDWHNKGLVRKINTPNKKNKSVEKNNPRISKNKELIECTKPASHQLKSLIFTALFSHQVAVNASCILVFLWQKCCSWGRKAEKDLLTDPSELLIIQHCTTLKYGKS